MALLAMSVMFTSCDKDKGEEPQQENENKTGKALLIGRWEASSTIHWTFDEKYVLIEDKTDAFNGEKTPYTYNDTSKDLVLGGFATFKVTELTATSLKITGWSNMTFKKVK